MAESTPKAGVPAERSADIRKAYGMATTRLREKYSEDFKQLQIAAAKELGVDWSPRLSKDEREERELQELLERRPDLREKLVSESLTGATGEAPDTKVESGL